MSADSPIHLISQVQGLDGLAVTQVEGSDRINEPFYLRMLWSYPDDAGLDPQTIDELLTDNQPCMVVFELPTGPHAITGQLHSIEMTNVVEGQSTEYRAELVPRAQKLDRTRRSRIFQDIGLPDLIRAVLGEEGFQEGRDFELRFGTTAYPTPEYVVQYEESDWAFLSRWLEHWGVHYHFEHDVGQDQLTVLVFGDANRAFPEFSLEQGAIDFNESAGPDRTGIFELHQKIQPQAGSVVLRDYNWRTPAVGLQNQAPVDQVTGAGFTYFYGEHFKDPGEGNTIATLRAEEALCHRETFNMKASLPALHAGQWFELAGHPLASLAQATFFVRGMTWNAQISTSQEGASRIIFRQNLQCLRSSVVFRPPITTPKPRVDGVMHGHVDGAVRGTAAPIDEHGRYKVLFPFDLVGRGGGHASRWIRTAQPSSGPGYGMHFPLHVGAEVMVAHVGGDPDRPVVVGSAHNATTINPVTDKNPTQSQIRTQAGVRIVIDDDC